MLTTERDLSWMARSACDSPDIFFPDDKGLYPHKEEAVTVCQRCPVQMRCLDLSLADEEWIGIWGGFTDRPRRAMFRRNSEAHVFELYGHHVRRFVEAHYAEDQVQ